MTVYRAPAAYLDCIHGWHKIIASQEQARRIVDRDAAYHARLKQRMLRKAAQERAQRPPEPPV